MNTAAQAITQLFKSCLFFRWFNNNEEVPQTKEAVSPSTDEVLYVPMLDLARLHLIRCFCTVLCQVSANCLWTKFKSSVNPTVQSNYPGSSNPASLLDWLTAPVSPSQSDINTDLAFPARCCRAHNSHDITTHFIIGSAATDDVSRSL